MSAVWLADWSDGEGADFRAAWAEAGIDVRVIRSAPLGGTVGTRFHRDWTTLAEAARGLLVPPRDPNALRTAMAEAAGSAERIGAAALEAARGPLSLTRFVSEVDSLLNK